MSRYKLLKAHLVKIYGDTNSVNNRVYGCTNSLSSNFNSSANVDDGSCLAVPSTPTARTFDASFFRTTGFNYKLLDTAATPIQYYNFNTNPIVSSGTAPSGISDLMSSSSASITHNYSILTQNSIVINYITMSNVSVDRVAISNSDRTGENMWSLTHEGSNTIFSDIYARPTLYTSKEEYVSTLSLVGGVQMYNTLFYTSGSYLVAKVNLDATDATSESFDCDNPDIPFGELENSFYLKTPGVIVGDTFIGGIVDTESDEPSTLTNSVGISKTLHGRVASFVSNRVLSGGPGGTFTCEPKVITISLSPLQGTYTVFIDAPNLEGSLEASDVVTVPNSNVKTALIDAGIPAAQTSVHDTVKAYTLLLQLTAYYSAPTSSAIYNNKFLRNRSLEKYDVSYKTMVGDNVYEEDYGDLMYISSNIATEGLMTTDFSAAHPETPWGEESNSNLLNHLPFLISTRLRSGVAYSNDVTTILSSVGGQDVGVGKKLVIIGTLCGFILTYVDNLTGVIMGEMGNTDDSQGLALTMYASSTAIDHTATEGSYGYLFKHAALSPHDNFLYAISEDKDTEEQYITVYDLTDLTHSAIVSSIRTIVNPLSGRLSDIRVEKDGSIFIYSKNSTEYIKILYPDLQLYVDILMSDPDSLIKEFPEALTSHDKSTLIDFVKYDVNKDILVGPSLTDANDHYAYTALPWRDDSMTRQLNIVAPVDKGESLVLGDLEQYLLVRDLNGEVVDYKEVNISSITDSGSAPFSWTERMKGNNVFTFVNNGAANSPRIISSAGGDFLALVARVDASPNYSVIGRDGKSIDYLASGDLLSVETFSDTSGVHYKILIQNTVNLTYFYSYKLTFDSGCVSDFAPYNLCMGTVVLEGVIGDFGIEQDYAVKDVFISNPGAHNTTVVNILCHNDSKVKIMEFTLNTDISTSTLTTIDEYDFITVDGVSDDYSDAILKGTKNLFAVTYNEYTGNPRILLIPRGHTTQAEISEFSLVIEGNMQYVSFMEFIPIPGGKANVYYTLSLKGEETQTTQGVFKLSNQIEVSGPHTPVNVGSLVVNTFAGKEPLGNVYVSDIGQQGFVTGLSKFPDGAIYVGTTETNSVSKIMNTSNFSEVAIAFGVGSYYSGGDSEELLLDFSNLSKEFGGASTSEMSISLQGPNYGCTNPQACNYSAAANMDDGTCSLPFYGAHDTFPLEDIEGYCAPCKDGSPVTHVTECGACQTDGIVTNSPLEMFGYSPIYNVNTGTLIGGCIECPAGTDLGNGTTAEGCDPSDLSCVEDISVCEFYGCNDSIMGVLSCNGYGTAESSYESQGITSGESYYPTIHMPSSCVYTTDGCVCSPLGEDGLIPRVSPAIGVINCTDCVNAPNTLLYHYNDYCNCERWGRDTAGTLTDSDYAALRSQGVCDCSGTEAPGENCDCDGELINTNLCNCAGQTSTELHGPHCDCDAVYSGPTGLECFDAEGHVMCDMIMLNYYTDSDGDGLYDVGTGLTPMCPNDPALEILGPEGGPIWILASTNPEPDGCVGFSDGCNTCIPYNPDGSLSSPMFIPRPEGCGCYDPANAPAEYECDCGNIIPGFCDCAQLEPYLLGGCGCTDFVANPIYTINLNPGGIANMCNSNIVFDACMVSGVSGEGASYDNTTNIYTLNGEAHCAPSGECTQWTDLSPLAYGSCCAGFVFDTSVNSCVLDGTQAPYDCLGIQGGSAVWDACDVCNGSTTVTPQCGCNNFTVFAEGTIIPGETCNCQGYIVDACGVCGGSNTTCLGCTNSDAYNYDATATIDNGLCVYYEITNPDDFSLMDTSVAGVSFNGEIVATYHTGDLINDGGTGLFTSYTDIYTGLNDVISDYLPTPEGNLIYTRDNKFITKKCQVISRFNPTLVLAGSELNAEVTFSYSISEPTSANIEGVQGSTNVIGSNTVSTVTGKAVSFYFRVSDELIDNVYIQDVFGSYLGTNIISVDKLDVDTDVIESGVAGTLIGLNVVLSTGGYTNFFRTNYHVYRVLMSLDSDGTISEIPAGISFVPYFPELDPNTETIYVCTEECEFQDWTGYSNNLAYLLSSGSLTASQGNTLSSGESVLVNTSVGTFNTAPTNTLYIPSSNMCPTCMDGCSLTGGYLHVCMDPNAIAYSESLGDCELEDNEVCEYYTPTGFCPNPDYIEFNPEATADVNYWTPDPTLCLTPIVVDGTNLGGASSGAYTITIEPAGANVNIDYIVYTIAGTILNTVSSSGVTTILNAPDCIGFMPIGFNYIEDWLDIKLTLKKGTEVLHVLDHGTSTTEDGSIALKTGTGHCVIGCTNLAINTSRCVREVREDVLEFTSFTVEVLTEESPTTNYSDTSFIVYNTTTGEKLVDLTGELVEGSTVKKVFALAGTSSLGVKVISENMLVYTITDEYGEVIKTKSIYNSTYFEPFTLKLIKPGCTNSSSYNYDSSAEYDDGSCISKDLYECIKNCLLYTSPSPRDS